MPMSEAVMPVLGSLALAIIACSASALLPPIRPLSCSTMAPRAASWPKANPAMAMAISRIGASENSV